jgi:hypothetical protein
MRYWQNNEDSELGNLDEYPKLEMKQDKSQSEHNNYRKLDRKYGKSLSCMK